VKQSSRDFAILAKKKFSRIRPRYNPTTFYLNFYLNLPLQRHCCRRRSLKKELSIYVFKTHQATRGGVNFIEALALLLTILGLVLM
jgi:hypothetical protein